MGFIVFGEFFDKRKDAIEYGVKCLKNTKQQWCYLTKVKDRKTVLRFYFLNKDGSVTE